MNPEGTTQVRILDDVIRTSGAVTSSRFAGILLGSLAGLAALLAVVGVCGVLVYLTAALMLAATLLGSLIPARRAAAVNPVQVL